MRLQGTRGEEGSSGQKRTDGLVSHAGRRNNRGAESGLRSKTRGGGEPLKDLEKSKNE